MLTAHGHQSQVRDALQAGAAGYLLKDTPADEVVRAVQAAHAGVTLPGAAG
jgi:DNA-binding NarL/FixJ family response regulator